MTLPRGWVRTTLADVATWGSGGTPSANNAAYYGGGIPWAVIGDLNDGVVLKTRSSLTEEGLAQSSAKLVPQGAVLVAMYGSIGKLGIAGRQMSTNQAIAFWVPKDILLPRYLFYYLLQQRRALDAAGKGATQRNISQTVLKPWPICLPEDVAEQRRIVDILEDHLSRLDAAESYLQRCRQRMTSLLELVRRREFASCVGDSKTLAAVANWGSGGTPKAKTPKYYEDGHIPWVNSGDLRDVVLTSVPRSITEEGLAASSAKWVPSGAVLVAMYGATIGRTAVTTFPLTTNQAVAFARPRDGIVSTEYLWWFLRSQAKRLADVGQGGAQPNISQGVLKSWPIDVPSPERQSEVVDTCSAWELTVREASRELAVAQARSATLRRALLTAAFSGKLTGLHTDPDVIETAVANERAVVGAG